MATIAIRSHARHAGGGLSLRVSDPDLVRTRVMPFVHEATGMPLDAVLAGSGLEDEFHA